MSIYVLQVHSGKEADTQLELWRQGYKSFVPRELRYERFDGEWWEKVHVLMPGYVFVETGLSPKDYHAIKCIDYVLRVLGDPPSSLPETEERHICWLSNGGEMLRPSTLTLGSTVQILDGPLKGHEAAILKVIRRQRRAVVAIPLHGKEHHITLSVDILTGS